jgi:hypothetical protein
MTSKQYIFGVHDHEERAQRSCKESSIQISHFTLFPLCVLLGLNCYALALDDAAVVAFIRLAL